MIFVRYFLLVLIGANLSYIKDNRDVKNLRNYMCVI